LNALTVKLAFVALALTVVYPFLKRVFPFPQAWLGIAFGFSIPMAYAAQTGSVPGIAWVLMIANMFWSVAYDTEYAMVDRNDDMRLGLKSSAILLGRYDVAGVLTSQGLFLTVMLAVGLWHSMGLVYYVSLSIALALVMQQYKLIRTRDRESCFKAFLNNNRVGCAIFIGIAADLPFRVALW
jgi:4-hydroxybenzoate polyprenyltransferase